MITDLLTVMALMVMAMRRDILRTALPETTHTDKGGWGGGGTRRILRRVTNILSMIQ